MVSRILVPLDGSPLAEDALNHIEPFLAATKTEALLAQAIDPSHRSDGQALATAIIEADAYLSRTARRLHEAGVSARTRVEPGPAADAILDVAKRERADLIAMSTRGRSGFARFTLGSVTNRVVRTSRVPVLVVPPGAKEGAFRRILAPYDGSPLSLRVTSAVKALARPPNVSVHVVHVMEPLWQGASWAVPERPAKEAAERYVAEGLPATVEVRKGDAAVEILEAASEHDADMIAMATHGRSGTARWALGSVTEKVLRASTRPLLVVRVPTED